MSTAINWDDWRRDYDSMSYKDHVLFYDRVYELHPVQQHVSTDLVFKFLEHYALPHFTVLECGGWNGELGTKCLNKNLVNQWFNFEICRGAVSNSMTHRSYCGVVANDWPWNITLPAADVFVAAHVLEHMRAAEVDRLIGNLRGIIACYVECPIGEEPTNWKGYCGSHILEVGWKGLDYIFQKHGFTEVIVASNSVRYYIAK